MISVSKNSLLAVAVVGAIVAIILLFATGIARVSPYGGGIRWPNYALLVIIGMWTICAAAVGVALRFLLKAKNG